MLSCRIYVSYIYLMRHGLLSITFARAVQSLITVVFNSSHAFSIYARFIKMLFLGADSTRFIKMKKILFLLLITLASCVSSKKNEEKFQPEILNSDRIVTCYFVGICGDGNSLVERVGIMGNLLLSQNDIAKAFQLNSEEPEWFKVESFIFDTSADYYRLGNQVFSNCISLKLLKDGEIWNLGKVYYS